MGLNLLPRGARWSRPGQPASHGPQQEGIHQRESDHPRPEESRRVAEGLPWVQQALGVDPPLVPPEGRHLVPGVPGPEEGSVPHADAVGPSPRPDPQLRQEEDKGQVGQVPLQDTLIRQE